MEDDNDNRIVQDEPGDDFEFKYNFVNTPWDDRTTRSKISITGLLISIFSVTMACVVHNFVIHFSNSSPDPSSFSSDVKCHLVKIDEHLYTARIYSIDTQKLLCVGAVVSTTSVIAHGVCVLGGPTRLRMGSPQDPRCKKGFSVDVIEPINHDGTLSKQLVLLSSYEYMADCAHVIRIGQTLDWGSQAFIIGRPIRGDRLISRQPAILARTDNMTGLTIKSLNMKSMICVMELGKCLVRAGDLLVQKGSIFGVASTSIHATEQNKLAWFADLRIVTQELKQYDSEII